jgi:hypothetical protein
VLSFPDNPLQMTPNEEFTDPERQVSARGRRGTVRGRERFVRESAIGRVRRQNFSLTNPPNSRPRVASRRGSGVFRVGLGGPEGSSSKVGGTWRRLSDGLRFPELRFRSSAAPEGFIKNKSTCFWFCFAIASMLFLTTSYLGRVFVTSIVFLRAPSSGWTPVIGSTARTLPDPLSTQTTWSFPTPHATSNSS